jgi:hypothetical protein
VVQADADPKPERGGAYDYDGRLTPEYAPDADGDPDPGEVVWVWVPFEEDPDQGKDRPVVVIGRALDGPGDLVALMVSSKDHGDDDRWRSIGAGGWDPEHRESWARLDRVLAVAPDAVRREGAALQAPQFLALVEAAAHLPR